MQAVAELEYMLLIV
jgi:hypothetical protein